MKILSFIPLDDLTMKCLGIVDIENYDEDTRKKIIQITVSESDFEKINIRGCEFVFENGIMKIIDNEQYINRYKILRSGEYPPIEDYIDAKVKQGSGNNSLIQEGLQQENEYIRKCLEVKNKYPKN